jgi:hypothetical protein
MFVPAPTQQTCQSSKREPSVTAVHKRRNLVSSCMYFYRHPMTHFGGLPQSSPRSSDLSRKPCSM